MSPRYPAQEPGIAEIALDAALAEAQLRDEVARQAALQGSLDPYRLQHKPGERYDVAREEYLPAEPPGPDVVVPSFWFDLLLEREAAEREQRALRQPHLRGPRPGRPQ
jgi:hypothetical protein